MRNLYLSLSESVAKPTRNPNSYQFHFVLLAVCLVCSVFSCATKGQITHFESRKEYLKGVGLPILVSIHPRNKKEKKELQLFIKIENLTKVSISKFQILFFANDENRQFLIPEEQKTPELICSVSKQIAPNTIYKCHVGPFVYSQVWSSIEIHSISFTTEDHVRHVISEEDLDDVVLWL
ncbi:hypothetical protein AB3N58_07830 [Leptospira sp. WS60.C2]